MEVDHVEVAVVENCAKAGRVCDWVPSLLRQQWRNESNPALQSDDLDRHPPASASDASP
jgi:hypothetical protein